MHPGKGSFDYFHLRGTIDEVLRAQSAKNQCSKEWKIINMLPTNLELWSEKKWTGTAEPLTKIKARETLVFEPNKFSDGDQLYTYFRTPQGKLIPFLEPCSLRCIWKNVKLGAVVYRSTGGHLGEQASNWDMRGITLHNKMRIPLNVFYKGRLAAQISAYDGMSYMGGSASTVYFDNDRQGLNMWDKLTFSYSVPGLMNKELFTVTLDDVQMQDVHIGEVQGGETGPDPDTAAYSVDRPVWTGITYYIPTGRYNSRMTNPLAPF